MKYININELKNQSVSHNKNITKKVIIGNQIIPHLTNFSQAVLKPKQLADRHSHSDMWEIFYIESGEGIMIVDTQTYILQKGTCVMVEPNEKHEIINNSQKDLIINYFGIV